MKKIVLLLLIITNSVVLTSCGPAKVDSSYQSKYEYVNKDGKVVKTSKPNKYGAEEFEEKGYRINDMGQIYFDIHGELVVSQFTDAKMKEGTSHTGRGFDGYPMGNARVYLYKKVHENKTISFDTRKNKDTPVVILDSSKDKFLTVLHYSVGNLGKRTLVGKIIVDIEGREAKHIGIYKGEELESSTVYEEIPQQRLSKI